MKILVPLSIEKPESACVTLDKGFVVRARRGEMIIVSFTDKPSELTWFQNDELL